MATPLCTMRLARSATICSACFSTTASMLWFATTTASTRCITPLYAAIPGESARRVFDFVARHAAACCPDCMRRDFSHCLVLLSAHQRASSQSSSDFRVPAWFADMSKCWDMNVDLRIIVEVDANFHSRCLIGNSIAWFTSEIAWIPLLAFNASSK